MLNCTHFRRDNLSWAYNSSNAVKLISSDLFSQIAFLWWVNQVYHVSHAWNWKILSNGIQWRVKMKKKSEAICAFLVISAEKRNLTDTLWCNRSFIVVLSQHYSSLLNPFSVKFNFFENPNAHATLHGSIFSFDKASDCMKIFQLLQYPSRVEHENFVFFLVPLKKIT